MYYQKKCVACETCVNVCPTGSVSLIDPFGYITNHDTCILCGECVDKCFYGAREIIGKEYSVDSLVEEVLKDKSYYEESDGGVTFSGGEPLLQWKELNELLQRLKEEHIHVALETAGHIKWEIIDGLRSKIDLFFFDLKHIDSDLHKKYTGVPNELILENMKKLSSLHENITSRIPVIPGVNEDEQTLKRMYGFLLEETNIRRVELLPYHRLGMSKYHGLGRQYQMGNIDNLSRDACEPYAELGRTLGLEVQVGAS
jgi:pyruvate formate lyase activating enzyme